MYISEKKANLDQFTLAVEKYRVMGKNIYNFNEKEFVICLGIIVTWMITYEELKSGEIIRSSQDSNQEWVILLASICAVVVTVPLNLIYQEKSGDLKNTQTDDIGQNTVYFTVTSTGWSNNKIDR